MQCGHAKNGNLGFVAVESDAGNKGFFHFFIFLKGDQGAGLRFFIDRNIPGRKAAENADGHPVFASKFHRTDLQHLGAHAGHFQHFLKTDDAHAARLRNNARIGGIDAIDIGVDQTLVSLQCRSNGHRRGVTATTPQRRDIALIVDSLETGDDDNFASAQCGSYAFVVDLPDPRLGIGAVGMHRNLPAGKTDGRHALSL